MALMNLCMNIFTAYKLFLVYTLIPILFYFARSLVSYPAKGVPHLPVPRLGLEVVAGLLAEAPSPLEQAIR